MSYLVDIEAIKVDISSVEVIQRWHSIRLESFEPPSHLADALYVVRPHSQHHATIFHIDDFERNAELLSVPENCQHWWKDFLPKPSPKSSYKRKIKIAIADAYHPEIANFGNISIVEKFRPVDIQYDTVEHGLNIVRLVHKTIQALNFPPEFIEIVFYSLDDPELRGSRRTRITTSRIERAITQAVKDDCDIISISAGTYSKTGDFISDLASAVDTAYKNDTVVFAAVGNDKSKPVAYPARHDLCTAVSALCADVSAPHDAVSAYHVRAAKGRSDCNEPKTFGPNKTLVYPWPLSCSGPEVDTIAPGSPIFFATDDRFHELSGTSFACPIAAMVFANWFAKSDPQIGASAAISDMLSHAMPIFGSPSHEGKGLLHNIENVD